MTSISRPLKPRPDRPVDPLTLMVIGEIQQAADRLGVPVFVVGAMARIILLENIHGLNAGRATTDADFAFAIDNWEQFHAIRALLLESPGINASERVIHRLSFRAPGSEHPYTIDLIPFGGIETSQNTVAWPPDMAIMMNVAGFSDAFAAAVSVEASPGFEFSVASLPGVAILKLFAWADRRQENPKDALDFLALLRSYHEAGNENRIYEDASAVAALVVSSCRITPATTPCCSCPMAGVMNLVQTSRSESAFLSIRGDDQREMTKSLILFPGDRARHTGL